MILLRPAEAYVQDMKQLVIDTTICVDPAARIEPAASVEVTKSASSLFGENDAGGMVPDRSGSGDDHVQFTVEQLGEKREVRFDPNRMLSEHRSFRRGLWWPTGHPGLGKYVAR